MISAVKNDRNETQHHVFHKHQQEEQRLWGEIAWTCLQKHPDNILLNNVNNIQRRSFDILTTSFNILPRCPAPGWGRLCVKVADYWGEQLLLKVFRLARSWRKPGCLRRCWWTWPGWSGSSPSCGELSQSATWRLPQRQNEQRELLAPATKEIRRVNLRFELTAGKKFLSKR